MYRRGQFDTVTAPTPMLAGSASVPAMARATERAAAAIPDARIHMLRGHGHFAHKTDPDMVTELVRAFVASVKPARHGRRR
ncbi:MAG: alpha/beta fold hydrolase [Pseudonocardia sp.]